MNNCKKCGAQLPIDANYCSCCGTSVKEIRTEELKVSTDDLVKTVKQLLHEGNVRRIIVKDEKGKILLDIPVTIGLVGTIIAPWLAALGVIGALATNCTIVVERVTKYHQCTASIMMHKSCIFYGYVLQKKQTFKCID